MRTKWIAVVAVPVLGLAAAGVWLTRDTGGTKKTVVATAAVDSGPVSVSVAATGALDAATRDLAFSVDGTVETVAVQPGAEVAKGDKLASVDDSAATSTVSDALDSLDSAKTTLETAASPSPSASTGSVEQNLPEQSGSSGSGGADSVLTAQERVNQARYALGTARQALAGTAITAPIAGTVLSVAGKVGSQVASGSTFVTLADTAHMRVTADFPEADAGAIAAGQAATVTLADRVGEVFPAEVVQVDPVGTDDGTLVTYGVLLDFTKVPDDLLVGQSAAVVITTGRVASVLRVPATAVHDAGAGAGVVLVRSGGVDTRRSVKVGLRGDQYTEITSGLTRGDVVVRSW